MPEGVAGLALGDRAEQGGHVRVALDVGLLGEVQVPAVGLALAGERLLEVVLGLGSLQFGHGAPLSFSCVSVWLLDVAAFGSVSGRPARPAVVAAPAEDDLGARRTVEALRLRPAGTPSSAKSTCEVAHLAAGPAHQVVVGDLDVGVEAGRARCPRSRAATSPSSASSWRVW